MSFNSFSPNGPPPLVPKRPAPAPPSNWNTPNLAQSLNQPQPQPALAGTQSTNPRYSSSENFSYNSSLAPPPPSRSSKPLPLNAEDRKSLFEGNTLQSPNVNQSSVTRDQKWNQFNHNSHNDYQQLASQVDTKTTESIMQRAAESEQLGMATLQELARQGDGLHRVERDVEIIHLQLDRGDRQLRSISGIGGSVANLMTSDKSANRQQLRVYHATQAGEKPVEVQNFSQPVFKSSSNCIPQVLGSTNESQALKQKLSEQDAQLERISNMMTNLHNIAGTINVELDSQNHQLDRISARTDQAVRRTHESNYKMQRLM